MDPANQNSAGSDLGPEVARLEGCIGDRLDHHAPEIRVRDYYAESLRRVRPNEHFAAREQRYQGSALRADMRTVCQQNILYEWEFKIHADYRALGQILAYVALARRELNFRPVRGKIAAFSFSEEVVLANELLNLGLELVTIPDWMRFAGGLPPINEELRTIAAIPRFDLLSTSPSQRGYNGYPEDYLADHPHRHCASGPAF
jgi:hypothetical protein